MDHGENTFYEGWSGKSSMKLRNFLRYYISGQGNQTKIMGPNDPNLERGRYSLVTQEIGRDGVFGRDEDALLEGLYKVIQSSDYKRNIYNVIKSGVEGLEKVRKVDNATIDKFIEE